MSFPIGIPSLFQLGQFFTNNHQPCGSWSWGAEVLRQPYCLRATSFSIITRNWDMSLFLFISFKLTKIRSCCVLYSREHTTEMARSSIAQLFQTHETVTVRQWRQSHVPKHGDDWLLGGPRVEARGSAWLIPFVTSSLIDWDSVCGKGSHEVQIKSFGDAIQTVPRIRASTNCLEYGNLGKVKSKSYYSIIHTATGP